MFRPIVTIAARNFRPYSVIYAAAPAKTSITDVLINDHSGLKEYYSNVKSAQDSDAKSRSRNLFVWELARHSVGEGIPVCCVMEMNVVPADMRLRIRIAGNPRQCGLHS
jgi:hypothetical protein